MNSLLPRLHPTTYHCRSSNGKYFTVPLPKILDLNKEEVVNGFNCHSKKF